MPKINRPRFGSLQFYPRKRVRKFLPRVNWVPVYDNVKEDGVLGVIGYKVGMSTAIVKDDSPHSMTKGKKISVPVTILEVPNMKIFSVRVYKNGKVMTEFIVSKDKELKRKLKLPKEVRSLDKIKDYDDIRVIVYSIPRQIELKKTPDFIELGISGKDKLEIVKNLMNKEISLKDVLKWGLVDVRGLTKGKGIQGPVRRFGITLKSHKSEKGVRNPGSLGPWHPNYVTFRVPMAGQLGMFTRVHYNLKVIDSGNIKEKDINKKGGFRHYGMIRGNYIILAGSVQGPQKRQVLVTPGFRPSKMREKKKYELISLDGGR